MKDTSINKLLNDENNHVKMLHQIVENAMKEEKVLIQNLNTSISEELTLGQRISDKIAQFGGSWAFIILFLIILLIWILLNVLMPMRLRFDPYPFILMNLILSCIAALQAPIIMMSQNRQEDKDRKRSENDYMINLKAELEIRSLHQKIDVLLEEQIQTLFKTQEKQFELLQKITEKLKN